MALLSQQEWKDIFKLYGNMMQHAVIRESQQVWLQISAQRTTKSAILDFESVSVMKLPRLSISQPPTPSRGSTKNLVENPIY